MRAITYYELKESHRVIAGDYLEIAEFDPTPMQVNSKDWMPSREIQRQQIPVHHIRWFDGNNHFFCLHPKLQAVLEAPFAERAEEAERRLAAANNIINTMRDEALRFAALPWWVRVWREIRRSR